MRYVAVFLFIGILIFGSFLNTLSPGNELTYGLKTEKIWSPGLGSYLLDQDLLVRDGKIIAMGENLKFPSNVKVFDLKGLTLLPGLIDAHTHLFLEDKSFGEKGLEEIERNVKEGMDLRFKKAKGRAESFLSEGITTIRDLGNSSQFGDLKLKHLIDKGLVRGPLIVASGPGLSPPNGQLPASANPMLVREEYRIINGIEDAKLAVGEIARKGGGLVKIYSDNAPNKQEMSFEEMRAIVLEAKVFGLKVSAHSVRDATARSAVLAGVDSIEHGYELKDETLTLMAKRGVFLVPTDLSRDTLELVLKEMGVGPEKISAAADKFVRTRSDRLLRAHKLGVPIAFGSDMYLDLSSIGLNLGQGAKEALIGYVDLGLSSMDAIEAGTLNSASLLGLSGKVGDVKVGMRADLIGVIGDPISDIRSLRRVPFVMKAGAVVRNELN